MRPTARIAGAVWLAAVWVALWGDPSPGTIVAGALVAVTLTLALPRIGPRELSRPRLVALVRFNAAAFVLLVQATWHVARHVLSPRPRYQPVITTVDLPHSSTLVALLVANVMSVTPGSLTLELRRLPSGLRLVVHSLDGSPETVAADVRRLHELARAAFPGTAVVEEPE